MAETPATVDARQLVEGLLNDAVGRRASDIHVEPLAAGYELRFRIDGLLSPVARYDTACGRAIVTRLMVLAHLLTYRADVPQEGRLTALLPSAPRPLEFRLAVMPTVHGLRAAVRTPAELVQPATLAELGLQPSPLAALGRFAAAESGMLLVTGPAGSGKTTTLYALLGEISRLSPGLSMVALEDPVERDLAGVTQVEVRPFGELTYERALRSILRQDPQVLMLGEIRDAATASLAVQAALSGHRLVSTFHAASPEAAIARLLEMGLEPYQITSSLFAIVSQRLLRKRVPDSAEYQGRVPVAEVAVLDGELRSAILARGDAAQCRKAILRQPGYASMYCVAQQLVSGGVTDDAEVRRVLGEPPPPDS